MIYTNCDIPAKLFYDHLIVGDLSVLGDGKKEELEAAFYSILDEYCDISGNKNILNVYNKQQRISWLERVINTIDLALYHITHSILTKEERLEVIDNLNAIKQPKINFDVNKPIDEEIIRIKKKVLGGLRNQLNLETSTNKKQSDNVKSSFLKDCVSIESILGVKISEKVSLRKYVAYSEAATEKIKTINKNGKQQRVHRNSVRGRNT